MMMVSKGVRKVALVAVLGFSALATATLGGCSGKKNQADLAMQESAELRERNATLEQSARDKDMRIADLEERLANCTPAGVPVAAQPQPQSSWAPPAPTFAAPVNTPIANDDSGFVDQGNGVAVATLAGNVLFDSGRATVKDSARKQLDSIARQLKGKYRGASIRVEGHTDSDPIRRSKWASNEALSQARADAVKAYLAKQGVATSKMESIGYGSSQPKGSKASSRRVEIVVTR